MRNRLQGLDGGEIAVDCGENATNHSLILSHQRLRVQGEAAVAVRCRQRWKHIGKQTCNLGIAGCAVNTEQIGNYRIYSSGKTEGRCERGRPSPGQYLQ
jgi:hypothetical protein